MGLPGKVLELPSKKLKTPDAPVETLPRQHTGPSSSQGISTNAVLLGLMSLPGAIVALTVSTPASAQAPGVTYVSNEDMSAALFDSGSVRLAQQSEDPNVRELTTKIARLVDRDYSGDTRAAFNHYAGGDGLVSSSELSRLLSDAGVGNFLTRGAWVSGIMERLDQSPNGNGDGKISWGEFNRVMASASARVA